MSLKLNPLFGHRVGNSNANNHVDCKVGLRFHYEYRLASLFIELQFGGAFFSRDS